MIQYQNAQIYNGDIINIAIVNEVNRSQEFICIGCGCELIAKLGCKNRHHFAHKKVADCNSETYLHKLGKRIFVDNYRNKLEEGVSIMLKYEQPIVCGIHKELLNSYCYLYSDIDSFDLTKRFDIIIEECQDGRFVPDILLTNLRGEKIYIEIAVTHECECEKINSGIRIIEFCLEDDTNLDVLTQSYYTLTNWVERYKGERNENKIRFYNFKQAPPKIVNRSDFNGCEYRFVVFIVYSGGRFKLRGINMLEYVWVRKDQKVVFLKLYTLSNETGVVYQDDNVDINYESAIIDAYQSGCTEIKSCFLCRYHASNSRIIDPGGDIFCKFLKIEIFNINAIDCKYYRVDLASYLRSTQELISD